jgi:hypothetical protein
MCSLFNKHPRDKWAIPNFQNYFSNLHTTILHGCTDIANIEIWTCPEADF